MKINICIGSSCHVKGSHQVVQQMQNLVEKHNLKGKIELAGEFCLGQCSDGVCVTVDGKLHSVKPESVDEFFNKIVLPNV